MNDLTTIENLVILFGFVAVFVGALTVGTFVVAQIQNWLARRNNRLRGKRFYE